ncbi:MAG TPA: hypothetical protein PLP14_10280, partial [Chitinophagaceae bacterium]|nr:hypothetical protein [Chitinophagaceae bacterium]
MSTSKNKSKPPAPPVKQAETESAVPTTKATGATLFRWIPYVVLMLGSLLLYANTFHHQYALDDEIVISKNEYVLRGISGFSDIFSKDLFDSFYRQMNTSAQLAGGRYRPLSVASFAVEQEFIGTRENANFEPDCWDFNKNGKKDPAEDVNRDGNYNDKDLKSKGFGLRHVNNALFYGMACCMLFLFLQQIMFRGQFLLPLAISLLFLAHPLHTEVVANVKSRDEIFSLFFMLLSLFAAHRYSILQNMKWLLLTCLSFFCALLSKEYGVTLFILIPLSLYLFNNESFSFKKNIRLWIGMILFFLIYYGIRSTIVQGNEGN